MGVVFLPRFADMKSSTGYYVILPIPLMNKLIVIPPSMSITKNEAS
jgi:hypothetical protein